MNIKIGEKIKKLRKEQDVTQEKLGEYLGISFQAISKWENGTALPDITLVPALARFFGVSTDELFAMNPEVEDEKVREYQKEYERLNNLGDIKGNLVLMHKALVEYPRNYQFMINLANSLFWYNATDEQDIESRENGYVDEAIKLCERILDDCIEDDIRHSAIQILSFNYHKLGRTEEAKKLAEKMPAMAVCMEMCLSIS